MEWVLALIALALLSVAAVSRRLSGTPITPAIRAPEPDGRANAPGS
jgi:hypothetical protein